MNLWTISQLAFFVVGFITAFAGDKLSIPFLLYGGISLFGIAAVLVGMEAAFTRRIILGRRRYSETYLGLPAVAQGVQFIFIGAFLIEVSVFAYFDTGRDLFMQLVHRPWPVMLTIGVYCLMQTVIAFGGYEEEQLGPRWIVTMNLLVSRLLPGGILIVIGVGLTGLGLLDLVAPTLFDSLGGGFLEVLYGLR
jgi:hypothetical protein